LKSDQALTSGHEDTDAEESFQSVKTLRNVNDWLYQARACCTSNKEALKQIPGFDSEAFADAQIANFNCIQTALDGFIESIDALIPRVRNIFELGGYTLTLHNQLENTKIDAELRDLIAQLKSVTDDLKGLQQDTVDDSATVKIVTFLSAFYLPGSFISVSIHYIPMNYEVPNMESRASTE
jgi:hypothetical protein